MAVNPNDTEEAIWAWLCESQLVGPAEASTRLLEVGYDARPVLRASYQACRETSPELIAQAMAIDGSAGGRFYGLLYEGLWYEAHGERERARAKYEDAVRSAYAKGSNDYMVAVAKGLMLRS